MHSISLEDQPTTTTSFTPITPQYANLAIEVVPLKKKRIIHQSNKDRQKNYPGEAVSSQPGSIAEGSTFFDLSLSPPESSCFKSATGIIPYMLRKLCAGSSLPAQGSLPAIKMVRKPHILSISGILVSGQQILGSITRLITIFNTVITGYIYTICVPSMHNLFAPQKGCVLPKLIPAIWCKWGIPTQESCNLGFQIKESAEGGQ